MRKIFVVAALFFCSQVHAQILNQKKVDSTTDISAEEFPYLSHTLDRVVITTNKYPKKQSQTGKVTTVIDKTTLDNLSGHTTGEILNMVAGVTVNGANNNSGTNQRISIRGSSDGNVLLLIDGIPANDPSVISNYFDLNFINPAQIERIEILKGGQSTLYGSDAVSGVINIITKKTVNRKLHPYASVSYGSYNSFNGNAGMRGQTNALTYNAFISHNNSDGFSSAHDSAGNKGFDRDGYKQNIFRGELGLKLTSDLQWNFYGNYSKYRSDIDAAAFTDDKDFFIENKNWQAGSGVRWKQRSGTLSINYQFNALNRFYLDDSTDKASFAYFSRSTYIGRTHFAELYETYKTKNIELLAGADYRRYNTNQVYHSISPFGPYDTELNDSLAKMWQVSPYASVVFNKEIANIELGGRWNYHNVYGNNFTYTFNPSFLVDQKLKVFANASSAFKTPTLFQLFDVFSGNKNLDPEKSVILEGGIEIYPASNLKLRANGFYRKTKNAIQYIIIDPMTFQGYYYNSNNQKNYGGEVEFGLAGERWTIHSNYTFTKGKVRSGYNESGSQLAKDTTYRNVYRVPDHAFSTFITYSATKKFSASSLLKYVGKRFEPVFASAPRELDTYITVDILANYRVNENLRAFIDLKNITNTKYFDILGYNSRRLNFVVGLDVKL